MINLKQLINIILNAKRIKKSILISLTIFTLFLIFNDTKYKSSFSLYPFYEEDDIQSQIASVANTYGFLETKNSNSFYLPDLIHAKSSLLPLLEKNRIELDNINLINHYNKNTLVTNIKFTYKNLFNDSASDDYQNFLIDNAYSELKDNIYFIEEYSGLTTISIISDSKELSQNLANELFLVLNDFYNEKSQLQAKTAIMYLQSRIDEIKLDIKESEKNYSNFKNENNIIKSPDLILKEKSLLNDLNQDYFALNSLNNELEIELVNKVKTENYLVLLDSPTYPTFPYGPGIILVLIYIFSFIHLLFCSYNIALTIKKKM
tara:strand:- start:4315 stop:5271 length:957 start_codon:yes stop_codon:yes gene_type:complete